MKSLNFTTLRPYQTGFMDAGLSAAEHEQCLLTLQNYLQALQNDADIPYVKFADVVDYEQPTKYIVESDKYSDAYTTPVLTAGKGFFLGYTNETTGIYPASPENPVIIFDDFTTSIQWVDFPFKVKSSAMKILTAKDQSPKTLRYVFQGIKNTFFVPTEHKRHWISTFAELEIKWPEAKVRDAIADFYAIGIANAASLDAEVKQRIIQLDKFLTFLTQNFHTATKLVKLKDVAKYVSTKVHTSQLNTSNYVSVENLLQNLAGKIDSPSVPANQKVNAYQEQDILLGNINPYLHKIWFAEYAGGCNQDVLIIRVHNAEILPKYLFFVLCAPEFWHYNDCYTRQGTLKRGNKSLLLNYSFPLPSIEEQKRIVSFLEKIYDLIYNPQSGFEKLHELRQKQLNYYLNLFFK